MNSWDTEMTVTYHPLPGREEGGRCYNHLCTNKATHRQKYGFTWYCYWCAVQINGKAKKKIIVSSKELLWDTLAASTE